MHLAFLLLLPLLTCCAAALEVDADKISIDAGNGVYTLDGNAVAKEDSKTFRASKIIVHKKESEKHPTKIDATGNVSYEDGKNTITSDVCHEKDGFVTFLENVVLTGDAFGTIYADKVVYETDTRKMNLTGQSSKDRVQMVFDEKLYSSKSEAEPK